MFKIQVIIIKTNHNKIFQMKTFAFAALAASASALSAIEFEYLQHIAKFGRQHHNVEEYALRLANFVKTHEFIQENNSSNATHVAGHNQFSDWHRAEYVAMLGYNHYTYASSNGYKVLSTENLPSSVNWVDAGAVTKVKNQGSCGSCWSFSTTGAMEGAHFVAGNALTSFSEQQLVDCAYGAQYGSYGCNGGSMDGAMAYYQQYNAMTEESYPYISGSSTSKKSCEYDASQATDTMDKAVTDVTPDSVDQLKAAVAQQPVSIAIEADKFVFQTYQSGVLNSTKCGTNLDHGVLIAGYGNEDGQDYWLVKNSWDTTWGDNGYIKIAMVDGEGICGIQMAPVYPTTN